MLTAESVRQLTDHITNAFEILHKVQKQEKEEGNFEDIPFSFDLLEKYHGTLFDTHMGKFVNRFHLEDVESYVFRIPKEKKQVRILYGISDGLNRVHANLLYNRKEDRNLQLKRFHENGSLSTCMPVTVIFED